MFMYAFVCVRAWACVGTYAHARVCVLGVLLKLEFFIFLLFLLFFLSFFFFFVTFSSFSLSVNHISLHCIVIYQTFLSLVQGQ